MQIGSRFRCYPTRVQAKTLWQWIGCQRFIFNAKVGEDRYFRTFARKSLSLAGQFAPIDQQYSHFKTELTPWLSEVPSQVLRNGAVKWMQAYSRYFQKLGGRPAIQSKHGKQSVWLTSELFEFVPSYCDIKSRAALRAAHWDQEAPAGYPARQGPQGLSAAEVTFHQRACRPLVPFIQC